MFRGCAQFSIGPPICGGFPAPQRIANILLTAYASCFYAQFLTSVHRKAHPSPPERSRLFIENEMAIWRARARGAWANMMYRIMMR